MCVVCSVQLDALEGEVHGSNVIVGNVGDSRVVAGHFDTGAKLTPQDLSLDHAAASNATEVRRLLAIGETVILLTLSLHHY